MGVVTLPVIVNSNSAKVDCVVVEGLSTSLILGKPGLADLRVVVDCKSWSATTDPMINIIHVTESESQQQAGELEIDIDKKSYFRTTKANS